MAANFYTLQETAEKLGIDEEKVKDLVRDRKLREYRDGSKRLYKTDDIDALVGQIGEQGVEEETVDITADSDESLGLSPMDDDSGDGGDEEDLVLISEDDEDDKSKQGSEKDYIDTGDDSSGDESGELDLDMDLEVDDDFAASLDLDGGEDKPVPEKEPMKDTGDGLTFDSTSEGADENDKQDTEGAEEDQEDEIQLSAVEDQGEQQEKQSQEPEKEEKEPEQAKTESEEEEISLVDDADGSEEAEEKEEGPKKDPVGSADESKDEDKSDLSGQIELEDENVDDADANLDSVDGTNINLADLTSADTTVGTTGVNVLSDTDDGFKLSDDSLSETKAMGSGEDDSLGFGTESGDDQLDESGDEDELGELDDDLNMDSVGSGSGLLDLSLQADDTSLGAVLDDILPGDEGGGGGADIEADISKDMAMDDEGAEVSEDETMPGDFDQQLGGGDAGGVGATAPQSGGFAARPAAQPIDETSGAFGISLLVPMVAIVVAMIAVSAGLRGVEPSLLEALSKPLWGLNVIWYVVIAMIFAVLLIVMIGSTMAGGSEGKTKKAKKPKKEKKKTKRKK